MIDESRGKTQVIVESLTLKEMDGIWIWLECSRNKQLRSSATVSWDMNKMMQRYVIKATPTGILGWRFRSMSANTFHWERIWGIFCFWLLNPPMHDFVFIVHEVAKRIRRMTAHAQTLADMNFPMVRSFLTTLMDDCACADAYKYEL